MPLRTFPYLLFIPMLAIYLYAGLDGIFDKHPNPIKYEPQNHALSFKDGSRAHSMPKQDINLGSEYEIALELLPAAKSYNTGGIIFMISNGDRAEQITLWQWKNQLVFMKGDDFDYTRRLPRIYLNLPKSPKPKTMISVRIKSDGNTTSMQAYNEDFTEKRKRKFAQAIHLPNARISFANDLALSSGWSGLIQSFQITTSDSKPALHFPIAQTNTDHSINNRGSLPIVLHYDDHHTQLEHHFFESIPKRLHYDNINQRDMIINLLGFIPLGVFIFFFRPKLQALSINAAGAVVCSFLLSFFIELSQVWIPGRNSSQTDLALNTLGGLLGWVCAYLSSSFYIGLRSKAEEK